jgi:hypothetical protein
MRIVTPRLIPLLTIMLLVLPWLQSCSAGYETPGYRVVSADGAFEIRDYPSLTVVSAPMPHRGRDGSFMKLFRFISGKNDHGEKIAMTTPVLMSGRESGTMSFIVPKVVAEKGVPSPANPDLSVTVRPAARFAVLRYSGSTKPAAADAAANKLLAWIPGKGLRAKGDPVFAYYNPPWTPGFMRRNEVLVPITGAP